MQNVVKVFQGLAASGLFASATLATAAGCPSATNVDAAAATSQKFLDAMRSMNQVPGMAAAVWQDGRVVWTGCSGWRDVEARLPVDTDTVFRFASVSKVLTTTAVAKLVEQGNVDLDKPVQKYLPWLKARWPAISVRQLAAHTSGLPHYRASDRDIGLQHFPDARAAVGIFADRPLLAPPGQKYSYSSWGYTLIAAVIEAQSALHVLDYLRRDILTDLDLDADGVVPLPRRSKLYELQGKKAIPITPRDFSYTWTGGGFAGTAGALVHFAGRLMAGKIVSPHAWMQMRAPASLNAGGLVGENGYHLGLGWRVQADADGAPIAHHAGATDGARSALVLWPDEQVAASVLSNAEWISSIDVTAMLLAAPFRSLPTNLPAAPCPRRAQTYRGHLGELPVNGKVHFQLIQNRCTGVIRADRTIQKHFYSASAWSEPALQIISFSTDGQLARAALVTPFGLFDLRAQSPSEFRVPLNSGKTLQLRFSEAIED